MLSLSQSVGRAFYGKFSSLRATQEDAIDPVLNGDDVVILSPTGSGKTEATVAPLVDRYTLAMRETRGCTLLYITPTRALANDLLRRLSPPLDTLGFSIGIRHGERNDLTRVLKPDILITTPESLDVMMASGEISLGSVRGVILDEVHLTYNTQRGLHLAILLDRLERFTGRQIQVTGLSATVAEPSHIWQFFRPGRPFAAIHEPGSRGVNHVVQQVRSPADLRTLFNTMADGQSTKVLVFTNSRRECDSLAVQLADQTKFGSRVYAHHSSLSRDTRLDVESKFQVPGSAICIATSTLELGVDIGDIDAVVLYGLPSGWESFLQRIGRGNRKLDSTNVVCVSSPEHGNPFLSAVGFKALISLVNTGRLEQESPKNLYGALVQQVLSLILAEGGGYQRVADLTEAFRSLPYVDRSIVESILSRLEDDGYLIRHGFQNRFGASDGLHRLRDLRMVWGNFPARSRDVGVVTSSRTLGHIPAVNLLRIKPRDVIKFAGSYWRIVQIKSDQIAVEPTKQSNNIEIRYGGRGPAMDPGTVEEMLRLLRAGITCDGLSRSTRAWLIPAADAMRPYLQPDTVPMVRDAEGYHYFTFAGKIVNRAIAAYTRLDSFKAEDVELVTQEPIEFQSLPDKDALESEAIQSMSLPEDLTVFQSLLPPSLLEVELREIWRKTSAFDGSLSRLRSSSPLPMPLDLAQQLQG